MSKMRKTVFEKYEGHCAYCGCELPKIWHIDHMLPVQRSPFTGEKLHPERDHIDNMMPSCPSCNINKHSETLEQFRKMIKGYMKHLNEISTQFKMAKKYGLVSENDIEVKFYFETLNQPPTYKS